MKKQRKWLSSPVDPQLHHAARIEAAQRNLTLAAFIRQAVLQAIENRKKAGQNE